MDELVPAMVNSLILAPAPSQRGAEARLKNLADLVLSALSSALGFAQEIAPESGENQVEVILDRFAVVVRKARRQVLATKGAEGRALELFLDRFMSHEGIVGSRVWT